MLKLGGFNFLHNPDIKGVSCGINLRNCHLVVIAFYFNLKIIKTLALGETLQQCFSIFQFVDLFLFLVSYDLFYFYGVSYNDFFIYNLLIWVLSLFSISFSLLDYLKVCQICLSLQRNNSQFCSSFLLFSCPLFISAPVFITAVLCSFGAHLRCRVKLFI